ncbi:hypothetical protein MIR68_004548 [Amoeboaphelidium protococcarum]|nr:hypothetical protein MIR68_004548 [Amoeboaphelidium protococcarum]
MKYQLLIPAFALFTVAQSNKITVGSFEFDNPPEVSQGGKVPLVRAGSTYQIKWRTIPEEIGNPETITLEYLVGVYPYQSAFTALLKDAPNQNSYDWKVPVDAAENFYFFRVSSSQQSPPMRARTSAAIRIFSQNSSAVSDLNPKPFDETFRADGNQQSLNDKNNFNNTNSTANSAVDGISLNVLSLVLVGFVSLILT